MNYRQLVKNNKVSNEVSTEGLMDLFKINKIDTSFIKNIETTLKLDNKDLSFEIINSVCVVEVYLHAMDIFINEITGKGNKSIAKSFFDDITSNNIPDFNKLLDIDNYIKLINAKVNEVPKYNLKDFKERYGRKDLTYSGENYLRKFNKETALKITKWDSIVKTFLNNFLKFYKDNINKINNLPKCEYTNMFYIAFNALCFSIGKMAEIEAQDSKYPNRIKSEFKETLLSTEQLSMAREGLFEIFFFGPIAALLVAGAYVKGKEIIKKLLNIKDKASVLKLGEITEDYKPTKTILKLYKLLGSKNEVIKYIEGLSNLKSSTSNAKELKNKTFYETRQKLTSKVNIKFDKINVDLEKIKEKISKQIAIDFYSVAEDTINNKPNDLSKLGLDKLVGLDLNNKKDEQKFIDVVTELTDEVEDSLTLSITKQEPLYVMPSEDGTYVFVKISINVNFKFNNKQESTVVYLYNFLKGEDVDVNDIKLSENDVKSISECLIKNKDKIEKLFHYNSIVYDGYECSKRFKEDCIIGNMIIEEIGINDEYFQSYSEIKILENFVKGIYPGTKDVKVEKEHLSVKEYNKLTQLLDRQGITYDKFDLIFGNDRNKIISKYLENNRG